MADSAEERGGGEAVRGVPRPFSLLETLAYGVALLAVSSYLSWLASTFLTTLLTNTRAGAGWTEAEALASANSPMEHGVWFAAAMIPWAVLGFTFLAALLYLRGLTPRECFGTRPVSLRTVGIHVFLVLAFQIAVRSATYGVVGPFVDSTLTRLYRTAGSPILLGSALIVAAPLFEEVFWRGFIFSGIARSRLGPWTAIPAVSALWALSHWHLGVLGLLSVFGLGLYLGLVRHKTGSVVLCVVLHAVWNAAGFAHTAFMCRT